MSGARNKAEKQWIDDRIGIGLGIPSLVENNAWHDGWDAALSEADKVIYEECKNYAVNQEQYSAIVSSLKRLREGRD